SSSCHCSWSQSPNDSLVFKFTNTRQFEWYGELMEHHGIVDLYWEDQYVTTIDTYDPANINCIVTGLLMILIQLQFISLN
ncbi:hypothetical protein LCGC14_1287210, partial [marine sediment metagenome]